MNYKKVALGVVILALLVFTTAFTIAVMQHDDCREFLKSGSVGAWLLGLSSAVLVLSLGGFYLAQPPVQSY